jgi:hypothetical protein
MELNGIIYHIFCFGGIYVTRLGTSFSISADASSENASALPNAEKQATPDG